MSVFTYRPERTVLDFHNSTAFIKALAGPPGGGKSVGCFMDTVLRCMRQPPDHQGVRKGRLGVVRSTYPKLRTTTLKTVNDWMPAEFGSVKQVAPMEGTYRFPLPDGTSVHYEILFIALESEKDLEDMKSLELSWIWLNEATDLQEFILRMAVQRVGRYPSNKDGVLCAEPGVLVDFNLPDKTHWLYAAFEEKREDAPIELADGTMFAPSREFFKQPPAAICINFDAADRGDEPPQYKMNPEAENLANLGQTYYPNQLTSLSWQEIKSFILMKWTAFSRGKLVHNEYTPTAHLAKRRTEVLSGLDVLIGIDTSGLHPGAVFGQFQAGKLVITDEAYGDDMAFEQFVEEVLTPLIAKRYVGVDLLAICDPSNPRDARTGVTPTQLLMRNSIRAVPAPTNRFELRRAAVSRLLNKRDGVVIDPECKTLIRGLGETYVFKKLRATTSDGATQYSAEADKGEDSHIVDGFQYLCLHISRMGAADTSRPNMGFGRRRVI